MNYFLSFLLLLCSHGLFGQVLLHNISLSDPNIPIAYRGFLNKIIVKEFENDNTVIIISQQDTLQKSGDYFYYEGSKMKEDTLTAIKENQILAQKVYYIENLQQPKIYLGKIRDSLVTVDEIVNNAALIVTYEPQIAISDIMVVNFDGFIFKKTGDKTPLVKQNQESDNWSTNRWERRNSKIKRKGVGEKNNCLNSKQIKQIKKMQSGDVLIIHYVVLTCPSCVHIKKEISLRFKIK